MPERQTARAGVGADEADTPGEPAGDGRREAPAPADAAAGEQAGTPDGSEPDAVREPDAGRAAPELAEPEPAPAGLFEPERPAADLFAAGPPPAGAPANGPAPARTPEGPVPPDRVTEVMPVPVRGPAGSPTPEGATDVMPAPAAAEQATVVMPAITPGAGAPAPAPAASGADAPTEVIAPVKGRRRRRRILVVAGAVVALLAALYGVDVALGSGTVPRGVTIAGEQVGGLTPAEAERRVRATVEPRTARPVDVTAGDVTSQIDPKAAGLAVDWPATMAQAGKQPLNPITRVRSFFTQREVGVVTTADEDAVEGTLQQLGPVVNRPAAEGNVRFEGVTPVPVPPVDGQELDVPAAHEVLQRDWTRGTPVRLPMRVLEPVTSPDDVTKAVADVATPAVSGPVTVQGENVTGTITPEVIAKALSFRADPGQGLVPELNSEVVHDALDPQLAKSEQPGRDATLSFAGGKPTITPSQDGRGVDYDATLKDLLTVLTKTGDERKITAVYAPQPAELTTEELNGLGITAVIGEFTTGGFAPDSGQNIKRAASVINGKIVKPGQTFSLNAATEPRDAAHGYVEAGVISDGHAARDIGGGVSQVATTLYNAAYFAGMTDVVHKPHSFYISRYPPGREATVVSGPLDMKFRNDNPTGVMIQTVWTPSTLTIRLYGTKRYDVTSTSGPRTKPTEPNKVELPAGPGCKPSQGAPGFTITDTRTLRDVKTGQVKTERRTTKYNPAPIVTCKES